MDPAASRVAASDSVRARHCRRAPARRGAGGGAPVACRAPRGPSVRGTASPRRGPEPSSGASPVEKWAEGPLLDDGLEVPDGAAERELLACQLRPVREPRQFRAVERAETGLEGVWRVVPVGGRHRPVGGERAGLLGPRDEVVLEPRVGDCYHRRDDLGVGPVPQVGDPVLRHDDIAQVPWDGQVAVVRDDVRLVVPTRPPGRPYHQYRPPVVEFVGLVDEVELAADAAHDVPVREAVGDDTAGHGGLHGVLTNRASRRWRRLSASSP